MKLFFLLIFFILASSSCTAESNKNIKYTGDEISVKFKKIQEFIHSNNFEKTTYSKTWLTWNDSSKNLKKLLTNKKTKTKKKKYLNIIIYKYCNNTNNNTNNNCFHLLFRQ